MNLREFREAKSREADARLLEAERRASAIRRDLEAAAPGDLGLAALRLSDEILYYQIAGDPTARRGSPEYLGLRTIARLAHRRAQEVR